MKKLFSILLVCATFALVSPAKAGLQVQLNGGTNNVAAASTNLYAIRGDASGSFTNGIAVGSTGSNQYIDCSKSSDTWLSFSGIYKNTSTNSIIVTYRVAGSVDLVNWTNNFATQTFTAAASSTNYFTILLKLTNAPPGVALRSIEVPTTASGTGGLVLTNQAFKGFDKNGI